MLALSRNHDTVVQSIRIGHYGITASLRGAKSQEFLDTRPVRWGPPKAEVPSLSLLAHRPLPLHICREEATGFCAEGGGQGPLNRQAVTCT